MGLTDFLSKRLEKNAKKRIKQVSQDSAQTMLATAMMSSTHSGDTSNIGLCKAALEGRPEWSVQESHTVLYEEGIAEMQINNTTQLIDLVGFVVKTEWENDPVIYNMPNPQALIRYGKSIARSFVEESGM